jgi:hypothetical protein
MAAFDQRPTRDSTETGWSSGAAYPTGLQRCVEDLARRKKRTKVLGVRR